MFFINSVYQHNRSDSLDENLHSYNNVSMFVFTLWMNYEKNFFKFFLETAFNMRSAAYKTAILNLTFIQSVA